MITNIVNIIGANMINTEIERHDLDNKISREKETERIKEENNLESLYETFKEMKNRKVFKLGEVK